MRRLPLWKHKAACAFYIAKLGNRFASAKGWQMQAKLLPKKS
jgi:hypothetical protein